MQERFLLAVLLKTLEGGECMDTLAPPVTWDEDVEGRVLKVPNGSREHNEFSDHFMAALHGQREQITVREEQVGRIQNVLLLWQTHAVKKQTMKTRCHENPQNLVSNVNLDAVERGGLFHGATDEIMPKIEKQGRFQPSCRLQNHRPWRASVERACVLRANMLPRLLQPSCLLSTG